MAVHKYFFGIEDKEVEVYKNGVIVPYRGEKQISFSNGILDFFKLWENLASYLEGDLVEFCFFGKNHNIINDFFEFSRKYNFSSKDKFNFENFIPILANKVNKKICLKGNNFEYYLEKNEFGYFRIPKDESLEIIYFLGNNIEENFLLDEIIQREDNVKSEEGTMASFFRNNLKV